MIAGLVLLTSCANDQTITAPPATKPILLGTLRVTVETGGAQPDPDGYLVTLNENVKRTIATNDNIDFADLPAGGASVELSSLAPNCWTAGDSRQIVKVSADYVSTVKFTVECFRFSEGDTGSLPVGVWQLLNWEFFERPDFSSLYYDLVRQGLSGTLMFTASGDTGLEWHWRETIAPFKYSYVLWGQAEVSGDTLTATEQSGISVSGQGDEGGPLHGLHRFSLSGDTLVITRPEPVDFVYWCCYPVFYDEPVGPLTSWTRLTLIRRPE